MSRSSFVADLDTLLPGAVPHVPCVSVSLSHRKDPGAGRERREGARRCRGRVRGVGAVPPGSDVRYRGDPGGAAHSSGSVGGGSAESCGNASVLNVVEILPCAERVPLHMGAHPLKTDAPGKPRNRAENPESVRGDAPLRCATPPHGPRRIRLAREGARQEPGPSKPRGRSLPPTTPIPASAPPLPARKAQCTYRCMVFPDTPKKGQPIKLMPSQCAYRCVVLPDVGIMLIVGLFLRGLNAPAGAWCSLTPPPRSVRSSSSGCLNAPAGAWCSLT